MSLPRTMFMDCPRCRGRCIRLYTAGTERGGIPVLVRKYQCERCDKTYMTVTPRPGIEARPTRDIVRNTGGLSWPRPDRKWSQLGLSRDAFA